VIAARLHSPEGKLAILLVLEPGNIEKLKRGQPIHRFLQEFMPELNTSVELVFAYTPDAVWVAEQLGKDRNAGRLAEILNESLSRPEVVVRDKTAEEMKKVL
jgi:hypothetical protein